MILMGSEATALEWLSSEGVEWPRQRRSRIAASERRASLLEDGVSVQRELAEEPRAVGAVEGGQAGVPDALLDYDCAPVLESDADGDNREVEELGICARETVDPPLGGRVHNGNVCKGE